MRKYNPKFIERKWQKIWERLKLFRAKDFSKKPKQYLLVEFPYPSAEGLHVGHIRPYTALDVLARKKRMQGYNVLYPIGWDAFGLPTENYALKTGIHPVEVTKKNIKIFKRQLKSLGLSFDWSREINTTEPKYYRWTQWIFLKMFEKGLAYQAEVPINWCPYCKIGLANEEVINGKHERCGKEVEQKKLKQWLLKITAYADRLIKDLEKVDYLEKIKTQQINWIGRSEGTTVKFQILNFKFQIEVFTTRIDTIFGVTALALAPEHHLIKNLKSKIENWPEVEKYIQIAKKKSDLERTTEVKTRTGLELKGFKAINPATQEEIPIWVADYVIPSYGGGSVMLVPAHDKRDWDFAQRYNLPIKQVIVPRINTEIYADQRKNLKEAFVDYGILINSGQFNGLTSEEAIKEINSWLEKKGLAKKTVQYKLRDWIFSRQRYWGEPIPLIHCQKCGVVALPEKKLPLKLPYVKKYQPTGTGESPLAKIKNWVETKCPKCKGPAKRETDTMPTWAGSNWYFMRYTDPDNDKEIASKRKLKYWLPVDWYNGGMEHTNLHLLYSRFIYKFLFDLGVVPQSEPYQKRISHGMVLAEDGRKMSKSLGNVINPDQIVKKYGADSLRVYEMFMGPFDQAINWSTRSLIGCYRFLNRIWDLFNNQEKIGSSSKEIKSKLHQLIKKVSEDIEVMKFNTAIAAMMEFVNFWSAPKEKLEKKEAELFLKILASFAPHLAEELFQCLSGFHQSKSIFQEKWPVYDKKLVQEETFELIIQINGRVRDKVRLRVDISEDEVKNLAQLREKIKKYLVGKEIKKVIFVPARLINFVIK